MDLKHFVTYWVQVSDVVFLHHFSGVARVPHIFELLGRDLARVLHQDLFPAWMLQEIFRIIFAIGGTGIFKLGKIGITLSQDYEGHLL